MPSITESGFYNSGGSIGAGFDWTDLDCFDASYQDVGTTQPFGINNLGQIVGSYTDADDNNWSFQSNDGTTCVNTNLGFGYGGINDVGWIAGSNSSGGFINGDQQGVSTEMAEGEADSINGFGQVVGVDGSGGGVLFDYNPSSGSGSAYDLSDGGTSINSGVEALLYDEDLLQDPDTLSGGNEYPLPLDDDAIGYDINNYNQIVGTDSNPVYPGNPIGMLLVPSQP